MISFLVPEEGNGREGEVEGLRRIQDEAKKSSDYGRWIRQECR